MMATLTRSRDAWHRLAEPWFARWQQLEASDRRALQWLGAFLALSMAWVVIWQPALQRLRDARATFEQSRDLHEYLKTHTDDVPAAAGPANVVAPGQLQGLVASSAAASGLVIERFEDDATGLKVTLVDAPAKPLLGWIGKLESRGVQLASIEMVPTGSGCSDARVVFRSHR